MYSYKIKAYTFANCKKVFSNSGQTVSIIVTDKKSKKVNAGRFKYIKNQYTISLNGKVKLQGEAYPSKKLKKKKTYYVRVRAYTLSNGKKVYGKWSSVKKVKIKK